MGLYQDFWRVKGPLSIKQLSLLGLRAWYGPYLPPYCREPFQTPTAKKPCAHFPPVPLWMDNTPLNAPIMQIYCYLVTLYCYLSTVSQSSPLKHKKVLDQHTANIWTIKPWAAWSWSWSASQITWLADISTLYCKVLALMGRDWYLGEKDHEESEFPCQPQHLL